METQKSKRSVDIEVVQFEPRLSRDFADLNYEWIEKTYTVEEHDREILDHPFEQIIEKGGQIFFAIADGQTAGTVALIEMGHGAFELAKMAVSPEYRGFGLSNLLMEACIAYSRNVRKSRIVLESNTKQTVAIALYRKFGFVETPLDPNSQFIRANIRMELAL